MNFIESIVSYVYCFFIESFELEKAKTRAEASLGRKGWEVEKRAQERDYLLRSLMVLNNPYLYLEKRYKGVKFTFPTVSGGGSGVPDEISAEEGCVVCKVRDSGAGTVRFQFKLRAPVDPLSEEGKLIPLTDRHMLLLSEVGREWRENVPKVVIQSPDGKLSLWDEFRETCRLLSEISESEVLEMDDEIQVMGIPRQFIDERLVKNGGHPLRPYPVLWGVCETEEYHEVRNYCFNESTTHVDKENVEGDRIAQSVMGILQILLGALSLGRDITYCKEYGILDKNGGFINFCPAANFFRNFSHRTCLCLSPRLSPSDDSEDPESGLGKNVIREDLYFMTIEVMEAVRLRWHLAGIANQLLDWEIQAAQKKLDEVKDKDPINQEENVLSILKELSKERARWAALKLRFMEDPVAHLIGSGSLNEMYDRAISIFRLKDFDDMLNAKSNALDRVINHIMDFAKVSQLLQLATAEKKDRGT